MENINPNSDQKIHSNDANISLPWPWKRLVEFARQPNINHPSRDITQEERYSSYKKWCLENDLSNADYIRKFVSWHPVWDVGLEPCLVPYNLESDIKHFILWFNDRSWGNSGFTPKKQYLSQDEFGNVLSESDFVWHMIQHFVPAYKSMKDVLSRDAKNWDQFPNAFEKEVIWYENHPDWKSIPEIKHLQVFFHTSATNEDVKEDLESIETSWIDRSAFLRHEKVHFFRK